VIDLAPQIFLYQDQVDALYQRFLTEGDVTVDALGMAMDGGEVIHVYLDRPETHFAGLPCPAVVSFHADQVDQVDQEVPDDARASVLIHMEGRVLRARGRVASPGGTVDATVHFVPVRTSLHTRSHGLLDTDALAHKSVAVVGLGSGGSAIAVALAQAGVGSLTLIDRDRLEIGNVTRHACGVGDLGRRKTRAVRDLVRGKNPEILVHEHDLDVVAHGDRLAAAIADADLVIAATDSDRSRFVLNQAILDQGVTAIFGRVLTRASGGDVLRVRPGAGPCLACVYSERFLASRPPEVANMREARESAQPYTSASDVHAQIQVGLASDIQPISNFMVKIALVELSRGRGGLDSLDADLTADFYTWANRREGAYASYPPMAYTFNQPAVLRWFGANIGRRSDCLACGDGASGSASALFTNAGSEATSWT
jgi:molybdopterin-synthase adenylyltransferase